MENNSLADLKDLQLPDTVSIFPLALGWYVVIALLILVACGLSYWQLRRLKKQRKIANIVGLLDRIEAHANPQLLSEVSILLKRVARDKFPDEHPQNLFGEKWLQFLDNSGKTTAFTQGAGRILLEVYQNKALENPEPCLNVVKAWLKAVI